MQNTPVKFINLNSLSCKMFPRVSLDGSYNGNYVKHEKSQKWTTPWTLIKITELNTSPTEYESYF
jgi:hypothetical protein